MDRRDVLRHFADESGSWREAAEKRIELHRKSEAELTLRDGDGRQISGAKIKLVQKKHEFKFGANCFMLDELESEEKNRLYKKKLAALFNIVTLPFYWSDTEPEEGKTRYSKDSPKRYRRPPIDLCMEFCEENGIEPREHALAYDHFYPDWLRGISEDETKKKMEHHFKEIAELYADRLPTVEVTNEMLWREGVTSFYKSLDFVLWCFETARKYFPNNELVINEWTGDAWENSVLFDYASKNIKRGAPIDAIGLQYHVFVKREEEYAKTEKLYDPRWLFSQMDMYATLGKPIQVTEVTVPAYSGLDEDESLQAEIINNLYTLWFSHPSVEQIIYWNLVDGYAYVNDTTPENIKRSQGDMTIGENVYYGGLLRFDMSEKPAYKMLDCLINKTWHTEAEVLSDADGKASFRGFYGDYDAVITYDGKESVRSFSLRKGGDNTIAITL